MAFVSPIQLSKPTSFPGAVLKCHPSHQSTFQAKRTRRIKITLSTTHPSRTSNIQRYHHTFTWRGYRINYLVDGAPDGDPVLLVHGFGASVNHWRNNIPSLVDTGRLRVYAIDLLGFGGSDKASPKEVQYELSLWKDLICDFIAEMDQGKPRKWSLVGNSIGSLISLMVANQLGQGHIRSLALMNCAGGLVSFRYSELNPIQRILLWLFNTILFNRFTGPALFSNFRTRENVASVLQQIYIDRTAITEELLDILCEPSLDDGACEVFLAVLNADAGPAPEPLLKELTWCPLLLVWGDKDPWTPLDRGFHKGINFTNYHPGIRLEVVENAGHCLHDERPEDVNRLMVPFLLEPQLNAISEESK